MNEDLTKKVMRVFPSLDSFKAGFLISVFGEENTKKIVSDIEKKMEEVRNVVESLTIL